MIQTLQTISEVVFVCVAVVNIALWILNGCHLPRYVHGIALIAFLLGGVGVYGLLLLGTSLPSIFWLPLLFAAVVYIVFILHGVGATPSGKTTENVEGGVMATETTYDKAEWHSDGEYPAGLSEEQAFVHTGLYLAWIVDHKLYSEEFAEDNSDMIEQFKQREILPVELYRACDGCFFDEMLNSEGNKFSRFYFDFKTGQFVSDYNALLVSGLPPFYHVADTWKNYDRLKTVVDDRFRQWKSFR